MHFADRLSENMKKKNSAVCVGLDPRLSHLPAFIVNAAIEEHGKTFTAAANAFVEFNKGIIDAVKDLVPCVKVQIAFYEEYGFQGVWAFDETCKYAKKAGLIVIADAKRNDIGSTAEAYAKAFIGVTDLFGTKVPVFDADAVTVSPYLGYDGIKPFIEASAHGEKGIFVLVKTSNPSAGDLQERVTVDEKMSVSALVGHFVESWGAEDLGECGYSNVAAVVAGNSKKEAKLLREIMPNTFFLVPGYGAQGGGPDDVAPCFDKDGMGAIVNNSRAIIFAFEKDNLLKNGENYAESARDATLIMRDELNRVRFKL